MLLDLSICLTVVVALLALTDLLICEPWKQAIAVSAVRFWSRLDDAKDATILMWLRRHLHRRRILVGGFVLAGIYLAWALLNRKNPYELDFGQAMAMAACVWVGAKIVDYTIFAESLSMAFVRSTLCLFAALVPISASNVSAYFFSDALQVHGEVSIVQLLWVIFYISTMILTPLVLIFWLAVAVPLVLVNVLILCFIVAEFLARRIAEYRSPILAVSIIIGIILAIIKAF
jgi:hypothetical protein